MNDLFEVFESLSPVEIMNKLQESTSEVEKKIYVGLYNMKSKMAFQGIVEDAV